MYKKLALACALLHRPKVLLLDEPTNGVDPVSRRELWELIYELVSEGMAVLLSTPYMDEAARCHRVGLMHQGTILAEGSPGELTDAMEAEVFEVVGGDRRAPARGAGERAGRHRRLAGGRAPEDRGRSGRSRVGGRGRRPGRARRRCAPTSRTSSWLASASEEAA